MFGDKPRFLTEPGLHIFLTFPVRTLRQPIERLCVFNKCVQLDSAHSVSARSKTFRSLWARYQKCSEEKSSSQYWQSIFLTLLINCSARLCALCECVQRDFPLSLSPLSEVFGGKIKLSILTVYISYFTVKLLSKTRRTLWVRTVRLSTLSEPAIRSVGRKNRTFYIESLYFLVRLVSARLGVRCLCTQRDFPFSLSPQSEDFLENSSSCMKTETNNLMFAAI